MKRIIITGAFALALTLEARAAKQPPAPPPLNLVTEAEPKAEALPAPPTAEQVLAAQSPEVQQAIKEHEKSGDWPIYKTPAYTLYPYNEGPPPTVDCEPLRTSDIQLQAGETITDVAIVTANAGWQRHPPRETRETLCRISQLSRKLWASRPTSRSIRRGTFTTCAPLAWEPHCAGGRVLLPRRADHGDEECRVRIAGTTGCGSRSAGR
jgi:hypothetical protein